MRNCVFRYIALLRHLSLAHPPFVRNIPVPKNGLPTVFSLFRETLQISCSMKYSLLSLPPLKSNILAEKIKVCEYAPLLPHNYLSQNQTLPLSCRTIPSPCPVSPQQGLFSYTLDTIPNGTCSHKQHGLYSSIPQGYYINVFPIEGNTLIRFSSPTKSRSIQSCFLRKIYVTKMTPQMVIFTWLKRNQPRILARKQKIYRNFKRK